VPILVDVSRSPLALAALATVAVPGLDAFDVRRPHPAGTEFDTAVVIDSAHKRWVVRAPVHAGAGAMLEAEVALLEGVGAEVDAGRLPFDVPRVAGFAHLPEGGRAMVYPEVPGHPLRLETLGPGPGLAASLGRAIAAIHEMPTAIVENAGLPVYDAPAYRDRRQAEVDEAARTGKVPPTLLRRWEQRLEDVSLWRFSPILVHGDLSAEHVLTAGGAITGILGWGDAKVADPADDLAWLLVAAPQESVDSIMEAYQLRRTELLDPHLADRAMLAGELALARWLLYGVRSGNDDVVEDAVQMLVELDEHTSGSELAAGSVS
jgi:aminoglycoside phosphotransferase (APT) family kinase protein